MMMVVVVTMVLMLMMGVEPSIMTAQGGVEPTNTAMVGRKTTNSDVSRAWQCQPLSSILFKQDGLRSTSANFPDDCCKTVLAH
jgi:hypothetical protein